MNNERSIDHAKLGQELSKLKGFNEGQEQRKKLILLGKRFRQLREEELALSQKEAAKLIGIEQPELSRIETGVGKRGPSFLTITRIISAYENHLRENDATKSVGLNLHVSHVEADRTLTDFEGEVTSA